GRCLPGAVGRARPARSRRRRAPQGRGAGHPREARRRLRRAARAAAAEEMNSVRELESRVGEEVTVSPSLDVTQERIGTFPKAIEDFQWIHVDPARAKSTPFGGTIAHGFLTLSLLSHLSEMTFSFSDRKMGINYGLNRVRFTAPVPSGARVRARFKLANYE